MNTLDSAQGLPTWLSILLAIAVVLALLAVVNYAVARWAERKHPPTGAFLDVDGARLHYSDRGTGRPVVLLHGNAVTGDDYNTSGVAERLVGTHRVVIFDRPGFGHSDRPRGRVWTASRQAELLFKALSQLGVERPVVVGHSWGAIVALAMAARHQRDLAGLVLLSGYYYRTLRPDVLLAKLGAFPVLGDVLRYTVSPLFSWLTLPLVKRALFSPARVPARFDAEYSPVMAFRPSQLRATFSDGALMIPGVVALQNRYKDLKLPVVIMAGDGDKVVFKRGAERLRAALPNSTLYVVAGAGHMVHHLAARQVADSVGAVADLASGAETAQGTAGNPRASLHALA